MKIVMRLLGALPGLYLAYLSFSYALQGRHVPTVVVTTRFLTDSTPVQWPVSGPSDYYVLGGMFTCICLLLAFAGYGMVVVAQETSPKS